MSSQIGPAGRQIQNVSDDTEQHMVSPPILLETLDDRATFMQWCVQQGFEITESFLLQLVSADIPEAGSMLLAAWGRLQVSLAAVC